MSKQNDKPIKVLQFICPTGFYGAERWILALGKHLAMNDRVVCDLAVTKEFPEHKLDLVDKYKETAGKVYEIPMSGRFDVNVIGRLSKLITDEKYDIIHTHGYKSDILGVIAAKKTKIKSVVTPHGFENSSDLKLRFFIWLGCLAMKYADKVVPLSKQLCDDVKRFGVKEEKLLYIQNGVDLLEVEEQRSQAKQDKKDPEERSIGFIGQMISRKNIFHILDIFDALSKKHPKIKLQLLGDGEERKALEEYAGKLASSDRIEFLGFRDDRLELLQNFDLFVMTSTLEGIPRCLMETMAMGVPVAAYDIPGIDQLVELNKTGMLAKLNDKLALASHWETLLFDESVSRTISENARAFILENYSAQSMAERYLALFEEMLVNNP